MSTIDFRQDAVKIPSPRSPAGEAFNDLLLLVLRLHGSFTAAGEALAKPAGQTLARWVILDQCRDTPATVSDIARRLRMARQSVQRIADLLVGDGLGAYQDNPHHQRAKLLELTAAGRSALYTIDAAQHTWCDTLAATIGEPTLRRTTAALRRVAGAVESTPPSVRTR
ncbi:MAG TPA: MarR family winged helix-turn-helix transcriptional regulator [Streptosporangiaceae bacterium]|jgi:DNA-binding MarR family transcriptional regulator